MSDTMFPNLAPVALRVSGQGLGKSSTASSPADTLFSTSTIRLIGLIGEGEIGGVVGGLKGVYRNEVAIQNADGTFNFKGITFDSRTGTPDQEYMPGFPGTESEQQIGVVVRQSTPVLASLSDTDIDRIRVTVYVPALFTQKSDGSVRLTAVNYSIDVRYYNGPWVSKGQFTISGKTSSGYYRQHEIPVPINPAGESAPWQVRVTRISEDDQPYNDRQDKYTTQSELVFYSVTSLVDTKFTYPRSALLGLTASTSQLGDSLGTFRVLTDGIKMPVPSNRDSATRTYSGIWDGTFKEEVCDNPVWFLNLLLTNDVFGLGEFIDQPGVDKISLYEIGRYCDQYVSNGSGGTEPRFTFNAEITEQQEAYDLLQLVAQIYRGMVYWGSGVVTSTQDRPGPVDHQVVPESVTEEGFIYSSSARKARHTVAMVAWHDPSNYYKETIEFVESPEGIARYGYNPIKIDLLGCTSRGQAHRAGLWALLTELYETQVVKYKATLDHVEVRPGDIVAIQDPQISNLDYSGRLLSASTSRQLYLDREVKLKPGIDHVITVTLPNGVISERGITGVTADSQGRSILGLANPLEAVPDPAAIWQISGDIVPQLFRVVSIREEEPHIYAVTALQHEPSKFAAVDDGAPFVETQFSDFPNVVLPPRFLAVREGQYFENSVPRQSLTLSWQAGQPFNSVGYFVTIIMPDGTIVTRPRTPSTSIDILDAPQGVYKFVVVAIGLGGQPSLPSELDYTSSGWAGIAAPTVENLAIKGGGLVFQGRSATLIWTNKYAEGQAPYPTTNYVNVFDVNSGNRIHTEILPVGQTEWTYDYNVNTNEGGPRRSFRVAVGAFAVSGEAGTPTSVAVSNPAPATVVFTLTAVGNTAFVSIFPSDDLDLDGYYVWYSETPGGSLGGTRLDIGKNASAFIPTSQGTRLYVRAAAYDAFSKDPSGLNIAAEQQVYVSGGLFDTVAPEIPQAPVVTALPIVKTPDGKISTSARATWPPSNSSNFGTFEIRARLRGNGDWTYYNMGTDTAYTFENLPLATLLEVQVRAVNESGFGISGWSPTGSVTTSASDQPPGPVTRFTAEGGTLRAFLGWTNPGDFDLAGVTIYYANSANGALSVAADVGAPTSYYNDITFSGQAERYYWAETYNTSGIRGPRVGPVRAVSSLLQAGQLAAKAVDLTKFADEVALIKNVDTLPGAPAPGEPTQVVLKGTKELYNWNPTLGRWVPAISGLGVNGSLTQAQIEQLDLSKMAGTLTPSAIAAITGLSQDQIEQLDLAKMAGTLPPAVVQAINTADLGEINAGQLTGALNNARLTDIPAAKVSGILTDDVVSKINALKLPSIPADKLTDTIDGQTIAGLNAAKVLGTLPRTTVSLIDVSNLVGNLNNAALRVGAANIGLGQYDKIQGSQLANLDAALISIGTLNLERIPTIPADKLSGLVDAVQKVEIDAIKIRGQIETTQIQDGAILTDKIGALQVTALNIAASAITGEKLAITSSNQAYNGGAHQGLSGYDISWNNLQGGGGPLTPLYLNTYWCPPGLRAVSWNTTTAPGADSYVDIRLRQVRADGQSEYMPVTGGGLYEFSAYLSAHRCRARVLAVWHRADGSTTAATYGNPIDSVANSMLNTIEEWNRTGRSYQITRAPADATTVELLIRAEAFTNFQSPGGVSAYLFAAGLMLAPAYSTTQTSPSPFVAPGTTIVSGGSIMTNTLDATKIIAESISTRELGADSVDTRQLRAGAIKADKIDALQINTGHLQARSVLTSKLAIASSNRLYNADLANGTSGWSNSGSSDGVAMQVGLMDTASRWAPDGFQAYFQHRGDNPAAGGFADVVLRALDSGNNVVEYEVAGGAPYEFSAAVSVHNCVAQIYLQWLDVNLSHIGYSGPGAGVASNYRSGGPVATFPRVGVFGTAPGNAAFVRPNLRMYYNGQVSPYIFWSAPMLAATTAEQITGGEFSPYVDPGVTTIEGGNIRTRSIRAEKIEVSDLVASFIETNKLTAKNIDAAAITALAIGTYALTADNIAANTIAGNKLTIASRGLQVVGLNMRIEGKTGLISWDDADFFYVDDNNVPRTQHISGGSFTRSGNSWYSIVWYQGRSYLDVSQEVDFVSKNPGFVLIATYDNSFAGLDVRVGSTIIDGNRILTGTIDADRIIARSIKAQQIGANEIYGEIIRGLAITTEKLDAQAVTAGKVAAGAIVASKLAIVSDNMLQNPDFVQPPYGSGFTGMPGWRWSSTVPIDNNPVVRNDFAPIGYRALAIRIPAGAASGGILDVTAGLSDSDRNLNEYIPVQGGSYIEASAYLCALYYGQAQLYLEAYDAARNQVGIWFNENGIPPNNSGGGAAQWEADGRRAKIIIQLPNQAVFVRLNARWYNNRGDNLPGDAYLFTSGVMLATIAKPQYDARELSPFSPPGATTISGSAVATGTLHADRIVASSIRSGQIDTDAIISKHIYAGSITSIKIDTQAIISRTIASGAITASKLSIGAMLQNIVVNGDFEEANVDPNNPLPAGWSYENRTAGASAYRERAGAASQSGENWLTLDKGGSGPGSYIGVWTEAMQPMEADSIYAVSGMFWLHNAPAQNVWIRVWFYDADKNYISYFDTDTSSTYPQGRSTVSAQFRSPGNARWTRVECYNWDASASRYVSYDAISLRRASGVTLIEDGAITTDKIGANQVVAKNIAAEAITARTLLLADSSNSILNGDFGTIEGRGNYDTWIGINPSLTVISEAGASDPGGRFRLYTRARVAGYSNFVAVQPGDVIAASAMVYNTRTGTPANMLVDFHDATGGYVTGIVVASTTVLNQWIRLEGKTFKAPDGAQKYRVVLFTERPDGDNDQGTYWGKVQARRAAGGSLIVDGSIQAAHIDTNSISAAIVSAGVVKADILSAGAIKADMIGVGLSTGNLVWNSDFALDNNNGPIYTNLGDGRVSQGRRTDWTVAGSSAFMMNGNGGGNWGPGGYAATDMQQPAATGYTTYVPVQGGQRYEISAYISVHRCIGYMQIIFLNGDGNEVGRIDGNRLQSNTRLGAPDPSWRSGGFGYAPGTAVNALVRMNMETNGGTDPYTFFSGIYFGLALPNQSEYSPYSPQSRTIITGAGITTGSLSADRIKSFSITTDQIQAGGVNADRIETESLKAKIINTDLLRADRIYVGTTGQSLNDVINGGSYVKIDGGALSANTIDVGKLKVGARGIQSNGIEFQIVRDSNGNLTNQVRWTAGTIFYMDENSNPQSRYISGNTVGIDGGNWYIYWYIHSNEFGCAKDNESTVRADRNYVMIATVTATTGLSVFFGGTVIDGTKITTRSITASQIAVNSLSADLIESGTVFTQRLYLGSGAISLEGENHRIVINNWENTQTRLAMGDVSPWFGGSRRMGLAIWGEDGNLILSSVNGLQADKINGSIVDNQLASGIGASKLTGTAPGSVIPTGVGSNILSNAAFNMGTSYWTVFNTNSYMPVSVFGIDNNAPEYALEGGHTLTIASAQDGGIGSDCLIGLVSQSSQGSNGFANSGTKFPVLPNQPYEASAYLNSHRCDVFVNIVWFDGGGNYCGEHAGNVVSNRNATGRVLDGYIRSTRIVNAPGNAYFAEFRVYMRGNGGNNPYLFMTQPFFGPARVGQTEVSPWNPGSAGPVIDAANLSTYIRGAIIKDAQIDRLSAGKIGVTELTAFTSNLGTVTAGYIRSVDGRMVIDLNNNRMTFSD